ncbi:MAG: hypothetical protein A2Y33_14360 [Spirochaetes bacterium GWF1_51_8]|nr:MAG: hypothetical protein A2Y33_14360 [Spirochaetes bacterium GWF1_51_8]
MRNAFIVLLSISLFQIIGFAKIVKTIPIEAGEVTRITLFNNANDAAVEVYGKNFQVILSDSPKVYSDAHYKEAMYFDESRNQTIPNGKVCIDYSQDGKRYMYYDNHTYGPFDSLGEAVFTKDPAKFGFTYSKNSEGYVYANGKTFGPYSQGTALIYAKSNPDVFAVMYQKNSLTYVVFQDRAYGPFYNAEAAVSPDGKRIMIKYNKDLGAGQSYVQVNDQVFGPYMSVTMHSFSPDGKSYAFQYKDKSGGYHCVVNGEDFGPYQNLNSSEFVFSRMNGKFAFVYENGSKDEKAYVYFNGKSVGPFFRISPILLNNNGTKIGFAYKKKLLDETYKNAYVYSSGKDYGPYNRITAMGFTPDGETLYFSSLTYDFKKVNVNEESMLYFGDKTFGPYWLMNTVDVSRDSKHILYSAYIESKDGKFGIPVVYYDGELIGKFMDIVIKDPFAFPGHVWFSGLTEKSKYSLYLDNQVHKPGNASGFINGMFSPDNSHYAFTYHFNGFVFIYSDGVSYGPYTENQYSYGFSPGNVLTVAYFDKKSGSVIVEEKAAPDLYPVLSLKAEPKKVSAGQYSLNITAVNTGNGAGKDLTLAFKKWCGSLNLQPGTVPVFSLAPGEKKVFAVPLELKMDANTYGVREAYFSVKILEPLKEMDSTNVLFFIALD